jgi:hypothetical protein
MTNHPARAAWRCFALFLLSWCFAAPASAARQVYVPISDFEDGNLINQTVWDARLSGSLSGLLFTLGREGGNRYDFTAAYNVSSMEEGETVEDARLRFNEQGGNLAAGLTVEISGALDLDPLAVDGAARFALPRTAARVQWTVAADWDSSGQLIAKWEESPDVSEIVNEIAAQPGWHGSSRTAVFFLEVLSPESGTAFLRSDDLHGPYFGGGNAGIKPVRLILSETLHDTFYGKELLCRPTPTSVEVNVIPRFATEAFVEWGENGISFPNATPTVSIPAATAHQFALSGFDPDETYFYRLRFRRTGSGTYDTGPEHSFTTLPGNGSEARICVTTDIHVTNTTAQNILPDLELLDSTLLYMKDYLSPQRYHLWMDLGDLVVIRATRIAMDQEEVEQRYMEARERIDQIAHSIPFVLVRGNHEEVNGWDADGTPNNTTIWSGKMLLKYFPPPLPSAYVSGNTSSFPHLGVPGNYFAFNVGRLRIRCLDPYLFSTTRPHNGHGEIGGSNNGWDWELGEEQYLWLVNDLNSIQTPYSLVALHHLTSCYTGTGQYYGRGGIEIAKHGVDSRPSFEWGGEDETGAHVLNAQRSGYVFGAVHDVLASRGNQVILKGHDHFHARQSLDDMTYVTLAKPDDTGTNTGNLWGWRFFSFYPEDVTFFAPNSGFLSIVVGESSSVYSYVQTFPEAGRGTILDSFTIFASVPSDSDSTGPSVLRTSIDFTAPNPARDGTRIAYTLAHAGRARLELVNAAGRVIRVLLDGNLDSGKHEIVWDGLDSQGRTAAAGVYFAKLSAADGRVDSVKMVVLN